MNEEDCVVKQGVIYEVLEDLLGDCKTDEEYFFTILIVLSGIKRASLEYINMHKEHNLKLEKWKKVPLEDLVNFMPTFILHEDSEEDLKAHDEMIKNGYFKIL